jgi:hypothetical protein
MFPHVTSQKHLSVFLRLHPMEAECVFEYDNSSAKSDSLSCLIVESKYFFTRLKTLKDLSAVAVEYGIGRQTF